MSNFSCGFVFAMPTLPILLITKILLFASYNSIIFALPYCVIDKAGISNT